MFRRSWRTVGIGGGLRILALGLVATCLSRAAADDTNATRPSLSGAELFREREFDAARRAFRAHLHSDPDNADVRLFLGWIALEEKKTDEAIDWVEQATRLDRTNAVYFYWLGRLYGIKAREAGFPSGAWLARKTKNLFEKAISLDPNHLSARVDLIRFHREAPAIVGGSRRSAQAQAKEVSKRDPYFGALVHGDLLKDEKKFREAERSYRSALTLNPQRLEARYRLGCHYQELNETEKAFAVFESILEIKPGVAAPYETTPSEAHYYIGKTGAISGQRLDRAEEALKIYLKSKPDYLMPSLASAHLHLGTILERKANFRGAREEYLKALALEPDLREAKAALAKLDAK